jgi:thioredoxin-like negative regulator of GroEL
MMIDVYHAADLPKIAATAGLHTTAAVIEELARECQARIKIVWMNVAENHKIPARFGIRGVPAFILFKQGEAKQIIE